MTNLIIISPTSIIIWLVMAKIIILSHFISLFSFPTLILLFKVDTLLIYFNNFDIFHIAIIRLTLRQYCKTNKVNSIRKKSNSPPLCMTWLITRTCYKVWCGWVIIVYIKFYLKLSQNSCTENAVQILLYIYIIN